MMKIKKYGIEMRKITMHVKKEKKCKNKETGGVGSKQGV